MSDIFNHALDAFESQDWGNEEPGEYFGGAHDAEDFIPDALFYHHRYEFKSIVAQTAKAYLFQVSKKKGVWVPKSICRFLEVKKSGKVKVRIHAGIFAQCETVRIRDAADDFEVL